MEIDKCPACKKEIVVNAVICDNCKFPFHGSEKEKAIHIGRFISDKGILVDSDDAINKSQKLLYFVFALNALFIILGISNGTLSIADIVLGGIIAITILFCGILIRKNPLLFTLFPLSIMVSIYTINFIIDPQSIVQGIFLKIFILGTLGYSTYTIFSAKKFKKKFQIKD